jgi:hypothetical protein
VPVYLPFLSCHNLSVAITPLLYSDKLCVHSVLETFAHCSSESELKTKSKLSLVLIFQEGFAILLRAKLLNFRCTEPKSTGSKTSILPHQVSAVSLIRNIGTLHIKWDQLACAKTEEILNNITRS